MSVTLARRGRPRAFDREQALRAAQRHIWLHGYEAASLSQLESVMGIGKTSLYAAFGSKFDLLREAADLYTAEAGRMIAAILDREPTALGGLRRFLDICAADFTNPARPRGCFLVAAAITCSAENAQATAFLRDGRAAVGALIRARLARGVAEGEFPSDASADSMTEYLLTVLHGMSIQARDGSTETELRGTVALAIRALTPAAD
jgi:AcrR family transcriptional regulator